MRDICGAFCVSALVLLACSEDPKVAQIDICGDIQVPQELDALRISILDETREERSAGVLELLQCPEEILKSLPQRIEVAPVSGDVWVVAQGLKDGVEVMRFERRAQSSDGQLSVMLGLTRDCLGASCPLGQTCINGQCQQAPFETGIDICVGSGELPAAVPAEDAGLDAESELDTGGLDAGNTEPSEGPFCPEADDADAGSEEDAGLDAEVGE